MPPLRVHLRLHNNHFTLLLPEVGSPLDQYIQDLVDAYDDLSAYPPVIDYYAQLPTDSLSEIDWSVSNTIVKLLETETASSRGLASGLSALLHSSADSSPEGTSPVPASATEVLSFSASASNTEAA